MSDIILDIFFTLGSIIFIVFGVITLEKAKKIKKRGIEVIGIISNLEKSTDINNLATIFPEVTFTTKGGKSITKTLTIGISPGYYKLKQKIIIIYDELTPESFIIKNRMTYFAPMGMILIGFIILFFIALSILRKT